LDTWACAFLISTRQSLFNAMQAGGIYTGPNGTLSKMQSQAGHIFADAPMIQN